MVNALIARRPGSLVRLPWVEALAVFDALLLTVAMLDGRKTYLYVAAAIALLLFAQVAGTNRRGTVMFWLVLSPLLFPFAHYPANSGLVTFDRICLLALGCSLLLSQRSAVRMPGLRALRWAYPVFLLVFLARALTSHPSVQQSVNTWIDAVLLPATLFIATRKTATNAAARLRIAAAASLSGVVVAMIGLGERATGFELASFNGGQVRADPEINGVVRVSGPFNVPEVYALVLVLTLAMTFYWMLAAQRRVLGTIAIALQIAGIFVSLFRVAWLSAAVVILLAVGLRRGQPVRLVVCAGLVAAAAWAFAFGGQSNSTISERLSNAQNIYTRAATYEQAVDIWRRAPLFGVGTGQYSVAQAEAPPVAVHGIPTQTTPHSSFLWILAEQGIVGFAALGAVVVALGAMVRRLRRRAPPGERQVLAACVTGGLIGYALFAASLTMLPYSSSNDFFAILVGLVAGALSGPFAGAEPPAAGAEDSRGRVNSAPLAAAEPALATYGP